MSTERINGGDPEIWTTEAFIQHFQRIHHQMPERCFAFVLGAGASFASGIATGAQLVDRWLSEIRQRDSNRRGLSVEEWTTSSTLQIDDFEYQRRAEFYPQVYHRRFRDDLDEGYAYLEDEMKAAEPSLGYSMLAQILAQTRHKITITTNFDNLVADSVLIFTDTFAQICGHESLTGFIRVQPRRPLVAKIHRDLLLGPQNDPYETSLLHEDWARELRKLFTYCTPIFIGYGGNDGSLMNFLEALRPGSIPGGIFWCYLDGGELPGKRICRLVNRHSGKLVAILNFDVFMTQLAEPLAFGLLDYEISKGAERRAKRLRDEWEEVKKSVESQVEVGKESSTRDEASRVARDQLGRVETRRARAGNDWWSWELRAKAEADPAKREAIYREALERLPNSPELIGNFANFLTDIRGEHDEAERLYRLALELDPNHAIHTGNFANFLWEIRHDYDEAERLYRRALELDPTYANATGNFANFMWQIRHYYEEAETLHLRVLELEPSDIDSNANYSGFLLSQGRHVEAQEQSDRAWALAKGEASQTTAEIALYRGLLLRLDRKNDGPALGRLKTLLNRGFEHGYWSFDEVLVGTRDALTEDDQKLYTALAAAILDPEKVAALEEFPRWQEVDPIPLDEPWPPLGGNSSP